MGSFVLRVGKSVLRMGKPVPRGGVESLFQEGMGGGGGILRGETPFMGGGGHFEGGNPIYGGGGGGAF